MSDPVKNSALAQERYKSTKSLYDDFSKRPTVAAHLVSQETVKYSFGFRLKSVDIWLLRKNQFSIPQILTFSGASQNPLQFSSYPHHEIIVWIVFVLDMELVFSAI